MSTAEQTKGSEEFEQIVSPPQRFVYGLGALGKDFGCAVVFLYTTYFLINVALVPAAFVGGLMLFARIFDAFTDPVMGLIVDNTRGPWGKFRPWILIGAGVNAVFIVALFTVPEGMNLQLYFSVMFILWGITYTMNDIPFWSMLPTLATGRRSREQLAVIPRIFAAAAWWLLGTFGIFLVEQFGDGNEEVGYRRLAWLMAVLFVGLSALCAFFVRSLIPPDPKAAKTGLKRMFKLIIKNDQLIAFIGCAVLFNLVIQLAGGMMLFYFTDVVGDQALFAAWQGFGGLTQMAALFLFPFLAKAWPRQRVYFISSLLPVIGLLLLYLTRVLEGWQIIIVSVASIIFNVGVGFFLGISTVMLADVVDYGTYKMGTRNESIVFSVQPMMVKFAAAFAGGFTGFGLAIVGQDPTLAEQTDSTKAGMTFLTIGLPIIAAVIGWLIYQFRWKLNGEFHEEVLRSLAAEREVPGAGGYPL